MSRASSRLRAPHSRSRPRHSRSASAMSASYLPAGPDNLVLPEGQIGESAADLLHDFVHPNHRHARFEESEATVQQGGDDEEDDDEGEGTEAEEEEEHEDWEQMMMRPWYRRPSAWWLIGLIPFSTIAMSSTIAPRVEIYTELACREHKPEYSVGRGSPLDNGFALDGVPVALSTNQSVDQAYRDEEVVTFQAEPEDDHAEPEVPPNRCASDPEVQAAVATLIAAMTSTMGILACLTTGFWGSFSDRRGRLFVMGISVFGILLTDFNFIFVFFYHAKLPGGSFFLLVGPLVEGALGGVTTVIAAMHAYVADTTTPAARSRTFSLSVGLLFVGMAIGPSVGSLLIRATGHVLSVFYLATAVHLLYALLVWFVIPESLSKRSMVKSQRRFEVQAAEEEAQARTLREEGGLSVRAMLVVKRAFRFLSPLAVMAPVKIQPLGGGKPRRDWNLTLFAAGAGFAMLVFGSYQYKFQYAAAQFGWSSEELGYYISLMGVTRAVYLTIILPLAIKLITTFKPAIQLPVEPSEPLAGSSSSQAPSDPLTSISSPPTNKPLPQPPLPTGKPTGTDPAAHQRPTPRFDLNLARLSLLIELTAFSLIPLILRPSAFLAFSMLASFGGGFGPAAQSLSLELYNSRARALGEIQEGEVAESGRLFGATSVIQVVASQIVGPTLFGVTYVHTVAVFPGAIFLLSAGSIFVALCFFSCIRLPKPEAGAEAQADGGLRKSGSTRSDVGDHDVDLERDASGEGVLITVDTVTDADVLPAPQVPQAPHVEREETLVEVDETGPNPKGKGSGVA